MRFVWRLCFLLFSASLMLAQSPTDSRPAPATVEDEIMVLRRLLAEQQQEITRQREAIGHQEQEIILQSREIQTLHQQVANKQDTSAKPGDVPPRFVNSSLTSNTPA